MGLESANASLADLNPAWPDGSDGVTAGDDHLRNLKQTLKNQFPNFNSPVTVTPEKLNGFDGRISVVEANHLKKDGSVPLTGNLNVNGNRVVNLGAPVGQNNAARLSDVQAMWPVGAVFFCTNNTDPNALLGFGVWERVAHGRFIVGEGLGTDQNGVQRYFNQWDNDGKYQHTLTVDQMPNHNHQVQDAISVPAGDMYDNDDADSQAYIAGGAITRTTTATGGNQPFGYVPPSFGLYIWERVA